MVGVPRMGWNLRVYRRVAIVNFYSLVQTSLLYDVAYSTGRY